MKKILTILFALFLLVGCGKGYSKLSDGSDVLFKTPDGDFTKNDLYKALKLSSSDAITMDIINKISELENIDTTDIEKEVDEYIELYKEMGAEYYLTSQYGSVEAYRNNYIASGALSLLAEDYIEAKYDEFVENDKPVKMQLAYFDTIEAANQMIADVNSGSTFDMAAANNGYDLDASAYVYLDTDTTLSYYVKQYLNETDTLGISSVITSTTTSSDADGNITEDNTYYVINVVDRDVNNFYDDYKGLKLENLETTDVMEYYFEKHEIKFYDQDIYEMMYAEYEVLK